jgi:hypothetical protein
VFAIVLSGVILMGLFGSLIVINRRREQAERKRPKSAPRPDPQLVDRPFDPALCAFCDEAGTNACKACGRRLCAEHRPWLADRFCWPCEAQWEGGARRRAFLITPLVLGGIVVLFGVFAGIAVLFAEITGFASAKLFVAAFVVPLVIGAPAYLRIERTMRRRFRPGGALPSATVRS